MALTLSAPSLLHRFGQPLQHSDRCRPVDAAVGDALAVDERAARRQVLAPGDQVALDHDAGDAPLPGFDLLCDVARHGRLILRTLAAVAVTDVDHDLRPQAGADDRFADAREAG